MFEQKTNSDSSDEHGKLGEVLKLFVSIGPATLTTYFLKDIMPSYLAWGISSLIWIFACYWIPPKVSNINFWFVKSLFVAIIVLIFAFLLGS